LSHYISPLVEGPGDTLEIGAARLIIPLLAH